MELPEPALLKNKKTSTLISYIFLIFGKRTHPQNFFIFQETETLKNFLYFRKRKR